MKLHHSALLILASCVAAGTAVADVTWEYASNTILNYTDGNTPNIPADNGSITKTGSGTVILALPNRVSPDSDPTIDGTASNYTGDVYINAGAIRLGGTNTNHGDNLSVSPDALGKTGTIHVASGAELQLGLAQFKTVNFNKSISLEGGKLYLSDGNYNIASALVLTANSTIQSQWGGKSHTLNGINAGGYTLTLDGETTNYVFNGNITFGSLSSSGQSVTVNLKDGETLTMGVASGNMEANIINLEGGSTLSLKNGSSGGNIGKTGGSINISNASEKNVVIQAGFNGNNTNIKSNIIGDGEGTLELQRVSTGASNTVTISGTISGNELAIVHTHGYYKLTGKNNTYGGGTTVYGHGASGWSTHNALVAASLNALGSGDVTIVGNGQLEVTAGATQSNTVIFKTEDEATTLATLTGASWEGTTLTGSRITGGSISNGILDVKGEFYLGNTSGNDDGSKTVTLSDVTVKYTANAADIMSGSVMEIGGEDASLTFHSAVSGSASTHLNSNIGGSGTLKFRADSENTLNYWSTTLSNRGNVIINGEKGDSGTIQMLGAASIQNTGELNINGGTLSMNGSSSIANTGAININGAVLNASSGSASISAGTDEGGNAINLNNGSIRIGDTVIGRTIYVKDSADATSTIATIGANGEGELDFIQVEITNSSIKKSPNAAPTTTARITNALINIDGVYSLENVTLDNNDVNVRSGGHLTLSSNTGITNTTVMDVEAGGTLDLTHVATLNAGGLNLVSGSTLIVGDYLSGEPITLTGSLTIEEGVIFDLSAWCRNDATVEGNKTIFEPYRTVFSYAEDSELVFDESLEGLRVTLIVDGYTNENGWLTITDNGKSLQLVPEPTTATLSLLALAGLAARRRRK